MTTHQTTDASDHDDFEPAPPDKLYAHHRRQLSAMMDGELSPDEAKFMLRRLEHDAALAGCWERWQVCGDALRGRRHALLPADFAQRVAMAIADDGRAAVGAAAAERARPRIARWGGGAALAASVAVVAFLVARPLPEDSASAPEPPAAIVAQAPAPIPANTTSRIAGASDSGTGAALAAVAVAAAEAPRRAAERRVRARDQRASDRGQAQVRDIAASAPVVADAELPTLAGVPMAGVATDAAAPDPFVAPALAPARPWPRAILQSYPADSAFTAGYGAPGAPPRFAPFEPRLEPRPESGTSVVAAAARAGAAEADADPDTIDETAPR